MTDTSKHLSFPSRLGRWAAELLLVFIGVYAAFCLNNYQQHQESLKRRDQILSALEDKVKEGLENSKTEGAKEDREAAQFRQALDAGKMPPFTGCENTHGVAQG